MAKKGTTLGVNIKNISSNFTLALLIVLLIFLVQLVIRESSLDVGIPFVFVYMKVTGFNTSDALGIMTETYSPTVSWSGLALDTIVYLAVVYPVVYLYRAKFIKRG